MANEQQLELLRGKARAWNEWRSANLSIDIDLSNAKLSGVDLADKDLRRADLNNANLSDAKLRGARLGGANLGDVSLISADLGLTDLRDADLSRAKLLDVNFDGADLRGAGLSSSNLYSVALSRARLSGADLDGAYLRNTSLRGADLSGTNLRGANLTNVNLRHAKLSGADLSRANLLSVDLSFANVGGADLNQATSAYCIYLDLDLRDVIGLETISHKGPSEVSISTIYRSEGRIPEAFLRGCGVPEDFITNMPSLTGKVPDFYSCFISYSHADKSFARRLHDSLQGRDIRCWLDEHQVLPGDDIYEQVDRGIRLWDKVLLCCSKDSLTSWWVDD